MLSVPIIVLSAIVLGTKRDLVKLSVNPSKEVVLRQTPDYYFIPSPSLHLCGFGYTSVEGAACKEVGSDQTVENGSIGMVLFSTLVAVCGSFTFGTCVGYSAPTEAALRADLNLSLAEFSMFGSSVTIGAMLGAITSGRITDFIGRKGAMRISTGFCISGWLAVFFSKGSNSLDLGRFFTGYGIGVISYVVPVYITEIAPKNLRGGLATTNQLLIVTGASVSFLIGSVINWKELALADLVPCICLLIGLCFIPEPPRWLDYIESLQSLPKTKLLDLFQSKHVRSVVIGVGLMVCEQSVGINGIGFYTAETFVAAGLSSGKAGTIAYACMQVVSATGTFLGCFIAGIAFFLKASLYLLLEWVPILAVAGVLIYIAAFSIGMGLVPWVIMSEIFPIHVKGTTGSLVVLVNWLGAWVVSYTFNFLMSWSSPVKLVLETKGKTLEEIQACISS
ncbi:Sugar transporter ERD6 16 [Spatholobus suberectus]|nr:Sugar transporter ERD6 16 [Spatholobus suberectus]